MECLDNIIKLSRTECECFDDNKPLDFNEGKSDIYLDELEGLPADLIASAENCENGNIWELMTKARENATKQFKADLLSCIGTNYTSKRANYSGLIGNNSWTSTLTLIQNRAGVVLRPHTIIGGYMTIKRLGLIFNATSTFDINIYSNEDLSAPIATYTVTSAANNIQYVDLNTPLKLPLWSDKVSNLEYYVYYDLDGSFYPKNNAADCGCTNKQKVAYKSWLNATGIKGQDSQELSSLTTAKEFHGLLLDVDLRCDSTRLICSNEYPLDFESDGRAMQMAYCVRFKAGELLLEAINSSGNINRYTLMNKENLWGKRNHFRAKYEEWIVYLCENTEIINNDCLMCRTNKNFSKGSILS